MFAVPSTLLQFQLLTSSPHVPWKFVQRALAYATVLAVGEGGGLIGGARWVDVVLSAGA